jgi:hypothetical protein
MDRSDPSVAGAAAFDIDQSLKHPAATQKSAHRKRILQINRLHVAGGITDGRPGIIHARA